MLPDYHNLAASITLPRNQNATYLPHCMFCAVYLLGTSSTMNVHIDTRTGRYRLSEHVQLCNLNTPIFSTFLRRLDHLRV